MTPGTMVMVEYQQQIFYMDEWIEKTPFSESDRHEPQDTHMQLQTHRHGVEEALSHWR